MTYQEQIKQDEERKNGFIKYFGVTDEKVLTMLLEAYKLGIRDENYRVRCIIGNI